LLEDFNLLISTHRGCEEAACSEVWNFLSEMGDKTAVIDRTGLIGLIVVKTNLDPFEVTQKLRAILAERPQEFRYTLKFTPIEKVIPTDLNIIRKTAEELSLKIGADEKFRVTAEKRRSEFHTASIVEAAAADVDRKVDLKNPDKIVLVEVLGKLTGVSVLKPNDILSITKEKALF